jgi:hypothetical protein
MLHRQSTYTYNGPSAPASPATPATPVPSIKGQTISKTTKAWSKADRARLAAEWVTGRRTVQPTVRLAATVFTISEPLIREEVKEMAYQRWLDLKAACPTTGTNGNGTEPNGTGSLAEPPINADAEVDRVIRKYGADVIMRGLDRYTSPRFAFAAE